MQSIRTVSIVVVVALLGSVVGVSLTGGVPDARITIDELDVSHSEPLVDDRVTVNVTTTSSPGSPAPVEITEVRLRDGEEVLDVAENPGALSSSDSLDVQLWTSFQEPGEHRLTIEVIGEYPGQGEGNDSEEVRAQRDLTLDVAPAERNVELRARALSMEEFDRETEAEAEFGGDIGGIFGGEQSVIEAESEDDGPPPVDSPVAVTVVNTGTLPAERVVVTPIVDGDRVGPFVAPDVAAGSEERLIVDLGRIDEPANATIEARYVANGSDGAATTELTYPPRDGQVVVTGAEMTHRDDGMVDVSANLGNVGDREIDGVTVRVGDAPAVEPGQNGSAYFVGVLGESDFVPVELTATVDVGNATQIPLEIEYNDRGVRYTETLSVAHDPPENEPEGGMFGTIAPVGVGLSLSVIGLVALGLLVGRRRV